MVDIRKIDRTGETNTNKNGQKMRILSYRQVGDIDIIFESGYISHNNTYQNFKKGEVRDYFSKDIFGVACLGQEPSNEKNISKDKSYCIWSNMLRRCYSEKYKKEHPSYESCYCCEEWLNYQNFIKWFNENYYE